MRIDPRFYRNIPVHHIFSTSVFYFLKMWNFLIFNDFISSFLEYRGMGDIQAKPSKERNRQYLRELMGTIAKISASNFKDVKF